MDHTGSYSPIILVATVGSRVQVSGVPAPLSRAALNHIPPDPILFPNAESAQVSLQPTWTCLWQQGLWPPVGLQHLFPWAGVDGRSGRRVWFSAESCCSVLRRPFSQEAGCPTLPHSRATGRSSFQLLRLPWQKGPDQTELATSCPFSPVSS